MEDYSKERRQFKRLLLPDEKPAFVIFQPLDFSESGFRADILNLSQEGMGLRLTKSEASSVCEGQRFYISEIHDELAFLKNIKTEIKWILGYQPSRDIRAGCELLSLSEDIRERISEFINRQIDSRLTEI